VKKRANPKGEGKILTLVDFPKKEWKFKGKRLFKEAWIKNKKVYGQGGEGAGVGSVGAFGEAGGLSTRRQKTGGSLRGKNNCAKERPRQGKDRCHTTSKKGFKKLTTTATQLASKINRESQRVVVCLSRKTKRTS